MFWCAFELSICDHRLVQQNPISSIPFNCTGLIHDRTYHYFFRNCEKLTFSSVAKHFLIHQLPSCVFVQAETSIHAHRLAETNTISSIIFDCTETHPSSNHPLLLRQMRKLDILMLSRTLDVVSSKIVKEQKKKQKSIA